MTEEEEYHHLDTCLKCASEETREGLIVIPPPNEAEINERVYHYVVIDDDEPLYDPGRVAHALSIQQSQDRLDTRKQLQKYNEVVKNKNSSPTAIKAATDDVIESRRNILLPDDFTPAAANKIAETLEACDESFFEVMKRTFIEKLGPDYSRWIFEMDYRIIEKIIILASDSLANFLKLRLVCRTFALICSQNSVFGKHIAPRFLSIPKVFTIRKIDYSLIDTKYKRSKLTKRETQHIWLLHNYPNDHPKYFDDVLNAR